MQNQYTDYRPRPTLLPSLIKLLLFSNGIIFLLQTIFSSSQFFDKWFALWPILDSIILPEGYPTFQPWQLVTYGFLHGNTMHLLLNMFALWMFGVPIENRWGSKRLAYYYFFCIVGAAITHLIVLSFSDTYVPTVGASGGVFGILLAFAMLFPNQRIMLIFLPIPIKAKYFVVIFGAFEVWAGVTGAQPGVANFAHLGGMIVGLSLILYWRWTSKIL